MKKFCLALFALVASLFLLAVAHGQAKSDSATTEKGAEKPATHPTSKPNILYILVDDLGYGDVGAFYQQQRKPGEPTLKTPNLDRMAAEGMRLTNHYCSAPVCAPSRASLLTGLHQGHCTIRDNQFDKPLPANHTLGTVLKQAGYYTAAIGKWGVGGKQAPWPGHPLHRGFDEYYGFLLHGAAHNHYAGNNGGIYDNFDPVADGIDGAYDTDLFTARAKRLIRQRVEQQKGGQDGKGQPFFLYLAYTLPHFKMQLPPGPYPQGTGLKGGLQWPLHPETEKPDSYYYPEFKDQDWPDNEKRFACMVRRLDECVGDVLQTLRDLGIDRNTLVVFSSDNGPHNEGNDPAFFGSWGPFDGFKRDLLEGGAREPTIAWWPGTVPAGKVCPELSAHYDWMATFAEAAGVPAPADSDGVSLLPSLLGKPEGQRHHPYLYFEYSGPMVGPRAKEVVKRKGYAKRGQMQAVRIGDFVGVRYDIQSSSDPLKLFNVAEDPHQDHNLSGEASRRDLLARMRDLLVTAREADPDAKRPYDEEAMPAVAEPPHTGGLSYRQFNGPWPWMPDFEAMQPQHTGDVPGLSLPETLRNAAIGVELQGYVRVPAAGRYTFTANSDSGAVLWVHDALVIDDDFGHDGTPRSGSVLLQPGWHPVRLAYRHQPDKGAPTLNVTLRGPDEAKDEPIDARALGWGAP